MRTSFPVEFDGNLVGKSKEAGDFQTDDGEKVSYGDAYNVVFENSEGLTQTVRISIKALDEACDFDVAKAAKFFPIRVVGDVSIGDGRPGSFRPTKIVKAA
jgi:hypothetical protein